MAVVEFSSPFEVGSDVGSIYFDIGEFVDNEAKLRYVILRSEATESFYAEYLIRGLKFNDRGEDDIARYVITEGDIEEYHQYSSSEKAEGDHVFSVTGLNIPAINVFKENPETGNSFFNMFYGGEDDFTGSSGADTIFGFKGDDVLNGRGGKDVLLGGGGDDRILGGNRGDRLEGGSGADRLLGEKGNDTLMGGWGSDTLKGGSGADSLAGGGGDDVLRGGGGNDTLIAGAGSDRLFGGNGNDSIEGGRGRDSAFGGDGEDSIFGEGGQDSLEGGDGADQLDGGAGGDVLRGGAGEDRLTGGSGADTLSGGPSEETMDVFVFRSFSDNGEGAERRDVIEDFDDAFDKIDLSGIILDEIRGQNLHVDLVETVISFPPGADEPVFVDVFEHLWPDDGDSDHEPTVGEPLEDVDIVLGITTDAEGTHIIASIVSDNVPDPSFLDGGFEILLLGEHDLTESNFLLPV